MFSAIGRVMRGALTAVIERMERRVYRNVVLPPGFVLPSKRDLTPRSADSSSADGSDGGRCKSSKSVRFLLPVSQAGGASGDANYVVVTPLDSPRGPRKGKPKRRKKKRKEAPATVKSLAFDSASRKLPRSFMPGLLAKTDSGSDSDASDSSTGRRRRRRREKARTSVRASTPPGRASRATASKRMRQLKPSRSAPRLVAPPRLWESSDSESDRNSPGGRRRTRLPRPRSALSVVGGYPSDDEADAVKSLTMASLKGRKHRRGTSGSGGGGSSRRARMYMPSQLA